MTSISQFHYDFAQARAVLAVEGATAPFKHSANSG